MTTHQRLSLPRTAFWLLAGVVVGGLIAGAGALALSDALRGDAPTEAAGPPGYVEEPGVGGIDHVYDGEFQFFVGGGVAVFDCNADLLPELYFAGGSRPAGLFINESEPGGALAYSRLASEPTELGSVTGAYPLDVDSDGITDLMVLRVGENVALRGLGGCEFERANELWGLDGGDDWTTAFSATWEDGGSLPSLAFGNYLSLDTPNQRGECETHQLFRPIDGSYGSPTELAPGWCTLSMLFSDWGRTGRRDLRATNDRHYYTDGREQLWRMESGAEPEPFTESEGWETMQIWGMGIASHDLTGDGIPEVFLTSQGDNKLQRLSGDGGRPAYEDVALALGATAHRPFLGDTNRPSTAWHAEFDDVNNDGFTDLFVSKGNVDSQVEFAMDDPNNLLLGQADGTFQEAADRAGILDHLRSRGAAVSDLNLDGLLDLVVVERREQVRIWRNTGSAQGGNWLQVDLSQPAPNVEAIGSWIEVRVGTTTLSSEETVGGGHAGGESGPTHFGIGPADSVDVRVIWPDGVEGPWHQVDANQRVVVDRETSTVTRVDNAQG